MEKGIKEPFLEHILEATKSVFDMMAGLEVEKDQVLICNTDKVKGDVTGVIGLSNDKVKGSIAISFPKDLGKSVVANMLSMDAEQVSDDDLKDGIGEITNMVAGDLNNRIGNIFKLSLPSIITGKGHLVSLSHNNTPILFRFLIQNQPFYLLTTFEEK
jgi:chemotaxis protein CheX